MTDARAEPLYDVSATWLLKERIVAQAVLIVELEHQLAEARNAALEEVATMADEWGDLSLADAIRALKTEGPAK
jgi:uncharacterized HAD superfamily protein